MQSKFSIAAKEARAAIEVPATPLDAIRDKASRPVDRPRYLRAVVLAGCALALVAAVAASWTQTRVWISKGHVTVSAEHAKTIDNPTQAQLEAAAHDADFPVVLPTGLPAGTVPVQLFKGGRSALMIEYRVPGQRNGTNIAWVVIANPKTFDLVTAHALPQSDLKNAKSLQVGEHIVAIFDAHDESVIVPKGALTTHELNVMEQAMGEGQGRRVRYGGISVENPTQSDLADVAYGRLDDPAYAARIRALAPPFAFHVTLPSGLPEGTKTINVVRLHGVLSIQYSLPGAWRASNHIASIEIIDPQKDRAAEREILASRPHDKAFAARFTIGPEIVVIPMSSLTKAEIARIRSSMEASNGKQR
jgi:hypothetical protein